ncbi:hypothetical protein ACWD4J_29185 [Streptomyces sp. NPDC002577]
MAKEPDMYASDIARRLGVDRSQVSRWKKELGPPVNPGASRPMWPAERVIELGKAKGYLDEHGKPLERAGETRRRPIPLPQVPEGRDEKHYYVPDIAAMFGATPAAVYAWIHRGLLPEETRWDDGQYPAWPLSELRRLARRKGVTLNMDAGRTPYREDVGRSVGEDEDLRQRLEALEAEVQRLKQDPPRSEFARPAAIRTAQREHRQQLDESIGLSKGDGARKTELQASAHDRRTERLLGQRRIGAVPLALGLHQVGRKGGEVRHARNSSTCSISGARRQARPGAKRCD